MTHPYVVLGVSVVATVVFAFVVYRLWKLLRKLFERIWGWFETEPQPASPRA